MCIPHPNWYQMVLQHKPPALPPTKLLTHTPIRRVVLYANSRTSTKATQPALDIIIFVIIRSAAKLPNKQCELVFFIIIIIINLHEKKSVNCDQQLG